MANYLILKKRFLFWCCSLNLVNSEKGWQLYRFLKEKNQLHTKYFAPGQDVYKSESKILTKKEPVDIPILLKMYLKIGAKICSSPAIDRTFNSIDYLI